MTTAPEEVRGLSLTLHDEAATAGFAERLARDLRPGDCLLMSGRIGAGKSFFARAAIQSMMAAEGEVEDVPSPTFTLVQTYLIGPREVWHTDLYRLSSPQEIDELGLVEAFDKAITFVEWPERLADLAPASALRLHFEVGAGETERRLRLDWSDPRWDAPLREARVANA